MLSYKRIQKNNLMISGKQYKNKMRISTRDRKHEKRTEQILELKNSIEGCASTLD